MGFLGFFKVLYSTVRNACRRLYNLGCAAVRKIWPAGVSESLHLTAVKLTKTVTNTCKSSYDLCCAAVRKVVNAVRVAGEQILKDYLSDSQSREKIGQIATTIVKYEADVAARTFLRRGTGWLHVYNLVRNELLYLLPSNHGSRNSKCSKEMMEEMKREMMEEMEEQMDKMHEVIDKKMEEMEKKMDKIQEEINNINYHNKIILERTKRCESPGGNISLRISTKTPDLGTLTCSQPAPPVVIVNPSQMSASTTLRIRNLPMATTTTSYNAAALPQPAPPVVIVNPSQMSASTTLRRRIRNLPMATTTTSYNAAALPLPYCRPVRSCRPTTHHHPNPLQQPSFCFPLSPFSSKSLPCHRAAH
ncbi:uncharacterized protein LOC131220337 [Magnolia sinica]|uniref:uncharacterized protein LOC131220337 n=1 Tax=Magnolia sinica TaxID=86752 RepID=UPI00265ADEF6|nr:uncharacterized protein LOC131220337 [Magnolia sinica]